MDDQHLADIRARAEQQLRDGVDPRQVLSLVIGEAAALVQQRSADELAQARAEIERLRAINESTVHGRREFRKAFRSARAEIARLREALAHAAEMKTITGARAIVQDALAIPWPAAAAPLDPEAIPDGIRDAEDPDLQGERTVLVTADPPAPAGARPAHRDELIAGLRRPGQVWAILAETYVAGTRFLDEVEDQLVQEAAGSNEPLELRRYRGVLSLADGGTVRIFLPHEAVWSLLGTWIDGFVTVGPDSTPMRRAVDGMLRRMRPAKGS